MQTHEQLTCEDKDQCRAHHFRPLLHQSRPPLFNKISIRINISSEDHAGISIMIVKS